MPRLLGRRIGDAKRRSARLPLLFRGIQRDKFVAKVLGSRYPSNMTVYDLARVSTDGQGVDAQVKQFLRRG